MGLPLQPFPIAGLLWGVVESSQPESGWERLLSAERHLHALDHTVTLPACGYPMGPPD